MHSHLGHSSLEKLKKLVLNVGLSSSFQCQLCHLGNHRMSYLPKINKLVSGLFQTVHSDVWAPCLVGSTFTFRYFVAFIDKHSRVTSMY